MSDYSIGGSGVAHPDDLGKLTEGLGYNLRNVSDTTDIEIVTAAIDGIGNVWTDCNVMDFSAHVNAVGTALFINLRQIVVFVHDGATWLYVGQRNVELGLGGNYTTVAADFSPLGTGDHALLSNRDAADAHPTLAITGLDTTLTNHGNDILDLQGLATTNDTEIAQLQVDVSAVTGDFADHIDTLVTLDPHPQYGDHQTLTGRTDLDCHPMGSVTGLNVSQQTQDTNITNLSTEQGLQRTEINGLTNQQGLNTTDIGDLQAVNTTNDQWHIDHVNQTTTPNPHPQYAGGAGTTDHAALSNREIADQHPIAAITGLVAEQAAQDQALTDHVTQLTTPDPHPQYMTSGTSSHAELANRDAVDAHPQSAVTDLITDQLAQDLALDSHKIGNNEHPIAGVTGLLADQLRQDTALSDHNLDATAHGLDVSQAAQDALITTNAGNFTDHINQVTTPEPHDQYLLVADYVPGGAGGGGGVDGYGGVKIDGFQSLGAQSVTSGNSFSTTPYPLAFNTTVLTNPVNITQDTVNGGLVPSVAGVWQLTVMGGFLYGQMHSDVNVVYRYDVRVIHQATGDILHNVVFGIPHSTVTGSARAQTNFAVGAMVEIPEILVDETFLLQFFHFCSSSSRYVTMEAEYMHFSMFNLGPLGP